MKRLIDSIIEIMPFLWLVFTLIHFIMGYNAMPMLCFTIFQFLTVYALLWSKHK